MARSLVDAVQNLINRVPAASKTPVEYVSARQPRFISPDMTRNDATSQLAAMGAVGTLFAIVNRTSNSTALAEWKLFRKARSGKPEDRVEVTDHYALTLWNQPNAFFTGQEFCEVFQQHLDLTGEAWWIVDTNPRFPTVPLSMWPVRPDRMRPVPSPTDFISGYIYTGPDGQEVPLQRNQVIFLRMPNPESAYRGMGPVQAILTDLESTALAGEWNRNFFKNSAEPGGIIEFDDELSDDQFKEFTNRWRESHQGVSNAHRVAILERGKWVDRKYTQRDMQFVELGNLNREKIREAFGIPKFAIGDVEDVNRATAEASKAWFAEALTVPRLERIKAALNVEYLALFGSTTEGLEWDYVSPVPTDQEAENAARDSKVSAFVKLVTEGGVTPSEACSYLDLPEFTMANGDVVSPERLGNIIQSLYLGVDTIVTWQEAREILNRAGAGLDLSVEAPEKPAPALPGQPAKESEDDPVPAENRVRKARRRVVPVGRPANSAPYAIAPKDIDLDGVQAEWERALSALLESWVDVTAEMRDALIEQIIAAYRMHDVVALTALVSPTEAATSILTNAMIDMSSTAAATMSAEAAQQGIHVAPAAANAAQIAAIAQTVSGLVGEGLANSAAREALRYYSESADADEVGAFVRAFLESLSERFLMDNLGAALTSAQNGGRVATIKAAPVSALYASEWMDDNTCKPCWDVDGKWIGNSDDSMWERSYPNGGYVACLGGVRCRGTVVAIWRPEQVRRT